MSRHACPDCTCAETPAMPTGDVIVMDVNGGTWSPEYKDGRTQIWVASDYAEQAWEDLADDLERPVPIYRRPTP